MARLGRYATALAGTLVMELLTKLLRDDECRSDAAKTLTHRSVRKGSDTFANTGKAVMALLRKSSFERMR